MRCQVKITTTVDGKKTQVVRKGDLQISDSQTVVTYEEETATVSVCLQNKRVTLTRMGDYSLFLPLEKGKTLDGTLGIGGNEGQVQVKTQRTAYSILDNKLILDLKYTLIVGEKQEMQVKIEAIGE